MCFQANNNNNNKPSQYLYILFALTLIIGCTERVCSSSAIECGRHQWQCDSGHCIRAEDRCDGKPHCPDGSDEIANYCIHLPCAAYAFRCAYGGCITGNFKCNGIRDCADNSDETVLLCSDNVQDLEEQLSGNCSNSMLMQCKSGECIDSAERCDGIVDCLDGSDETVELCSHLYCPSYGFKCGYGGCIRGNARCDGLIDCRDGSDEAPELCGYKREEENNQQPPIEIDSSVGTSTRKPRMNGCRIPFNRKCLIAQDLYSKEFMDLGTRVPSGSTILFRCESNYVLEGEQENECIGRRWKYAVPFCAKFCSPTTLSRGISTEVACFHSRKPVNCSADLRINTRARISCSAGYMLPRHKVRKELHCDNEAEWDYPKFKCDPICGTTSHQTNESSSDDMPWHISILKLFQDGSLADTICAGAILSPKIIITAANCFVVNNLDRPITDALQFQVLLGHQQIGKELYNISEILVPDFGILEPNHDYQHVIALMVLVKYLIFTEYIKPICLNLQIPRDFDKRLETIVWTTRQKLELRRLANGYAYSAHTGRRRTLTGIVSDQTQPDQLLLININFYADFISQTMARYKYIL